MNMGEKIRALRLERGLTLQALGDRVGVGAGTVRKWETGFIETVRADKVQKLATALNTTAAYLMGWADDANPNPYPRVWVRARRPVLSPTAEQRNQRNFLYSSKMLFREILFLFLSNHTF